MRNLRVVPKNMIRRPQGVPEKIQQLRGLQGTHIAAVTDVMEDANSFYIVSEFCSGGDVGDWMDRLNEDHLLEELTCATYIRQALLALSQSHASGTYHRDLRPQSMLLTSKMPDATVKVNDIGLAAILDPDGSILQRHGQSSPYMAPEVRDGSEGVPSGAADMWSIGAIAHHLLVGAAPNEGSSGGGAFEWLSRLTGKRNFDDIWAERSPESRDFVECLLISDPSQRTTAARALTHPWLKGLMTHVPATGNGGYPGQANKGAANEEAKEIRNQTLCYTLAVLLIPVLVPYRDFEQLREAFATHDTDNDDLNSSKTVHRILLTRCALSEAVTPALSIMDVGRTGAVDLCATACADLAAREFFAAGPTGQPLAGPFRASDLAPRMLKRFFEVFGERRATADARVATVDNIRSRLRTATARDMEKYGGVSYEELLEALPVDRGFDSQALGAILSANAGQGTPLGNTEFELGDGTLANFDGNFFGLFQTCGVSRRREESPHTLSVGDRGSRRF